MQGRRVQEIYNPIQEKDATKKEGFSSQSRQPRSLLRFKAINRQRFLDSLMIRLDDCIEKCKFLEN